MKAVINIQMDNQAFEQPHTCMELEKILCKIADTVGRQAIGRVGDGCAEADSNGNFIAKLEIVEDWMIKIIKFIWNIDDVFWPWLFGNEKWKKQ